MSPRVLFSATRQSAVDSRGVTLPLPPPPGKAKHEFYLKLQFCVG
jgi:hypothetical protein